MSNLVKFPGGGLPASADDLVKGLQNVATHMAPSAGGTPFMRLGKDGIWVYGQENIEVEIDSQWAINPYSMQHGWACWIEGELAGEVMVPMTQSPPPKSELEDFGEEWRSQLGVIMQCVAGEDQGQVAYYKSTSIGMQNAVRELNNAIMEQLGRDKVNIVPIVTLDADSYQHKKHGKIYTPLLEIVRWVSMETGTAEEKASEAEEVPADDVEPETVEAPADEKPTRSRRRGASREEKQEVSKATQTAEEKPSRRRRRGA